MVGRMESGDEAEDAAAAVAASSADVEQEAVPVVGFVPELSNNHNKPRGHESGGGERVYRRRIRRLDDLPVHDVPPPVFSKERGQDAPSGGSIPYSAPGSEVIPVVKKKAAKSELKRKSATSNGGTASGLNASLVEVQPELGKMGGGLKRLYSGGASNELGRQGRKGFKTAGAPTSKSVPSKPLAKQVGHQGSNGKLAKTVNLMGGLKQRTIDHFFKDPPGMAMQLETQVLARSLEVKAVKKAGTIKVKALKESAMPGVKAVKKSEIHGVKAVKKSEIPGVRAVKDPGTLGGKALKKSGTLKVKGLKGPGTLNVKAMKDSDTLKMKAVKDSETLKVKAVKEVKDSATLKVKAVTEVKDSETLKVKAVKEVKDSETLKVKAVKEVKDSQKLKVKAVKDLETLMVKGSGTALKKAVKGSGIPMKKAVKVLGTPKVKVAKGSGTPTVKVVKALGTPKVKAVKGLGTPKVKVVKGLGTPKVKTVMGSGTPKVKAGKGSGTLKVNAATESGKPGLHNAVIESRTVGGNPLEALGTLRMNAPGTMTPGMNFDIVWPLPPSGLRASLPAPPERKRMVDVDKLRLPPKGNVFAAIPEDKDFSSLKRRKINGKEAQRWSVGVPGSNNGELPSKKRSLGNAIVLYEDETILANGKKRRMEYAPPIAQSARHPKSASLGLPSIPAGPQGKKGLLKVSKKILEGTIVASGANLRPIGIGMANTMLAPINVPLEALNMPSSHAYPHPVSVTVEALRQANMDPMRIPVGSLGIPHHTRVPLDVPVEALQGEENAAETSKQLIPNVKKRNYVNVIKKDGTPDGRFKENRSAVVVSWNESGQPEDRPIPSRDHHAKKLPEVQKNGVRKPKRVQLKSLFADRPAAHPSSPSSGANSRIVKSLWSRPRQTERTDAEVSDPQSALVPVKQLKSTKFLSLQQIDASERLHQPRANVPCLDPEESEGNESDRTVSDSPLASKQQFAPVESVTESEQRQTPAGPLGVPHSTPKSKPVKRQAKGGQKNPLVKPQKRFLKVVLNATEGSSVKRKNDESESLQATHKKTEKVLIAAQQTKKGESKSVRKPGKTDAANMSPVVVIEEQAESQKQAEPELENCFGDNAVDDSESDDTESSSKEDLKPASPEPISGGELDGSNGVPRMTPRTRKLTDAMQNFIHQKATLLLQWKEMELGKLHPMALIGRSCKVLWPLDNEWYPGVIHEYNPQTRRHRIDYEDDEREWVSLGKERVKLYVSAEESKTLEMSFGETGPFEGKKLDADELAVLAASHEGCHGELSHGDLVWAKVKGYPMWPACVMDEEHASAGGMEPSPRERTVPVQFFGSYDYARINAKKVVPFAKGIMHKYHSKCKRTVFEQGLQEIERYLKECKLPDQMAQLQEDVEPVVTKKVDDLASNDESDEEGGDENSQGLRQTLETTCSFPLELGALRVLALGSIVKDSEQFHSENHIWTEGYTAVRQFASMKDPEKIVEYKMEVLRNLTMPSLPLFRVTPEDEKPVEDSTASGCWKRILIKIQRAKEKAGLCIATLLEKKRQSFRSGPSMFGFGHRKVARLIQALPNARACSKFTAWMEKQSPEDGDGAVAPAGYRPVEVNWKHLDRCNICYLDEEYTDNQLLQCDKCRTMVHMCCYGEREPQDGDLWLCNQCRPEAPKRSPLCCLCPVTGGAMKPTTDGRWAHLTCAMWTPETCLVDVKRMEPVDGVSSINKERWKLVCTICKVAYGACLQCSKPNCRVPFHPLCARGAGLRMEVKEDRSAACPEVEGNFQILTYCKKHSHSSQGAAVKLRSLQTAAAAQISPPGRLPIPLPPQRNPSGCARCDPYNAASRRGHRQPEAVAAAFAKRFFVENKPYFVTGCQRNVPDRDLKSLGGSLWSRHWKHPKPGAGAQGAGTSAEDDGDQGKAPQSMSERYRHMRSTMHERLTFGKSSIHGWGVFTKRPQSAGDMVIEYAGEIVRPIIADIRERRSYDSLVGAGTYMFRIDDERVVDATHAGSIAHLINHSCEPNCYSRVVTASGDDHIIIFAKRDIREGEELTYDYRFASKDEHLYCYCGCAGCRGFVNSFDREEEPNRIRAPRSELTKWGVS